MNLTTLESTRESYIDEKMLITFQSSSINNDFKENYYEFNLNETIKLREEDLEKTLFIYIDNRSKYTQNQNNNHSKVNYGFYNFPLSCMVDRYTNLSVEDQIQFYDKSFILTSKMKIRFILSSNKLIKESKEQEYTKVNIIEHILYYSNKVLFERDVNNSLENIADKLPELSKENFNSLEFKGNFTNKEKMFILNNLPLYVAQSIKDLNIKEIYLCICLAIRTIMFCDISKYDIRESSMLLQII